MPELPEVITIRNDLKKEIIGKKVVNIKKAKSFELSPSKELFGHAVLNHTVEDVNNIAKLLLIKFSSGDYIATHLNMSGVLLFNTTDPHTKVTLEFDTNDQLHYSSIRMFGYFEAWPETKVAEYKARHGKTAIESDLTLAEFKQLIQAKKVPIKNILLNQKIVSGIGNIYANDALYMSKIHPKKKASLLTDRELEGLFANLQTILHEGIEHRGSTIDRYRDLYGKPGTHQNYFRIYGKKNVACEACGTKIVYEKIQGRPTYYCPTCQPESLQPKLL